MDTLTDKADPSELDIRDYLNVIWRRKWVIVASLVLVTAVTLAVTLFLITPKYKSTTEILQKQSGLDKVLLGSEIFQQLSSQPEREIQTAAELVKSPEVISAVSNKLGDRLAGQDPASFVETKPVSKADIIRITATNADSQLAADIANTFAAEYIGWRQRVDRDVLLQARAPIESQLTSVPPEEQESASYQVLKDKLETLKLIEAIQVGNMEVVKSATASSLPVSPKPLQTGAIALFIGLISGIGIAFLMEHLDTKVRSTDEVVKHVEKPILTTVPMTSENGALATLSQPLGACSEAYRVLKTNLGYIEPDREIKSIMVTSPEPGEGKSTTVANLAITMARAGQKVIVLEADWRRPMLAKYFNLEDAAIGTTNALSGNCTLRETLQMIEAKDLVISGNDGYRHEYAAAELGPQSLDGVKPIYCATAGPLPPNPGELAASDKLGSLIDEASEYADVVLVDAPPFGVVGDAASMASKVDGTLLVVRLAKTSKRSLNLIQQFIDSIPSNVLGLVVTDANAGGTYSYHYGGYYNHSGHYY